MKSSCGTLSFLAPEVFKGTANAGPPLDVWAMGVILFALLCGRLPFEGPDLIGTKRPRDAVIKSRIMKCQYKLDDNLGMEAKVRLVFLLTPSLALLTLTPIVLSRIHLGLAASAVTSGSRRAYHRFGDLQPQLGAHCIVHPVHRSVSSVSAAATAATAPDGHHVEPITDGQWRHDTCCGV